MNAVLKQVVWEVTAHDIDVEAFAAALDGFGGVEAVTLVKDTDNADLIGGVEFAPCSIGKAESGCDFLQHVRRDAVGLPEPHWKDAAVLAANAAQPEGRDWFHEVSKADSRYTPQETDRKFDQTKTPPPRCATIAGYFYGCTGCPHWGRISTPLDLGRPESNALATAPAGIAEIRLNQYGQAVALVDVGGYRAYVPLKDQIAQDTLMLGLVDAKGRPPSQNAIEFYSARARTAARGMPRVVTRPRIIHRDGGFAINMADGNYLHITASGVAVLPNDGLPFTYRGSAGRLPVPFLAWRDAAEAVQVLEEWFFSFGIDKPTARLLLAAWLLTLTPHDGVTFLILQFCGTAGSGKTTAAQSIISTIAPVNGGEILDSKPDPDSLLSTVQEQPIVFMDNVTKLDGDTQDTLCKCATGTTPAKRELYSNADAFMAELHAPVVITGVSDVITRHDLRDRALTISVRSRRSYRSKQEVREDFRRDHPRLLGALCYLAHIAMRDRQRVSGQRAWNHRLTDWLITGEAISQAVGEQPGMFVERVEEVQRQAAASRLEDDGWLSALVGVLKGVEAGAEARDDLPSYRGLQGAGFKSIRRSSGEFVAVFRPETLLKKVRDSAIELGRHVPQAITNLPDSARALNKAVEQAAPTLKRVGLTDATRRAVNGPNTTAWYFMWSTLEAVGSGE